VANLEQKRRILREILTDFAIYPPINADIRDEPIIDTDRDRYLLITVGWNGNERLHHCTLHLSIIQNRIHIEANNTDRSIAEALTQRGIDPSEIVIALQPPDLQPRTAAETAIEFA
jgi:hypothetical protein